MIDDVEISTYFNEYGRGKWKTTLFNTLKEAEEYVSGWIQYSEDNIWRYYQREQLRSNHSISTWIRIKKVTK